MACEAEDLENNFENLKGTVRKSFALIYATLKARELKTLRQLDAILKQCQNNLELQNNCVQNIHISYEVEPTLLDNVNNYAVIDFERLSFDSNAFAVEDYVCPNDDHMYSYKCIDDITKEEDLSAIEEAALKQITNIEDCVCFVNINSEDVSKKFRDKTSPIKEALCACSLANAENVEEPLNCVDSEVGNEKNNDSDVDIKKIEPTEEWLHTIRNQTEIEPSQVNDLMD